MKTGVKKGRVQTEVEVVQTRTSGVPPGPLLLRGVLVAGRGGTDARGPVPCVGGPADEEVGHGCPVGAETTGCRRATVTVSETRTGVTTTLSVGCV